MESHGSKNQSNKGKGKRKNESNSLSEMAQNAIKKIKHRPCGSNESKPSYVYRDMNYPGYEWLLPGWVVEERTVKSGRIYVYYYDPEGQRYKSKIDVLTAWEQAGVVVIDP